MKGDRGKLEIPARPGLSESQQDFLLMDLDLQPLRRDESLDQTRSGALNFMKCSGCSLQQRLGKAILRRQLQDVFQGNRTSIGLQGLTL
jgi:hypothetical protein